MIKLTLSEKEAAEALGCSISTVQALARQRKVPATRFGDAGWVFPIKPFEEFLNSRAWANMEDPPEPPQTPTQQIHNILIGPGRVGPLGKIEAQGEIDPNRKIPADQQVAKSVMGFACGGVVKPKGPPKLVPLVEPPEVGASFGPVPSHGDVWGGLR